MLEPLTQFVCDCCGQLIEKPQDGYVEWRNEPDPVSGQFIAGQFKIVHHYNASPLQTFARCYPYSHHPDRNSMELYEFMKFLPQNLIFFLDTGYISNPERESISQVANYAEFADFIRRFTVPYFEQARLFFPRARREGLLEGYNEISLYMEHTLKYIIEYFTQPREDRVP